MCQADRMAASVLITAKSTRPQKQQPPASRDARSGIEIKFWRRFIYTAVYEAMICRAGQPTGNAILQHHWIENKVDPDQPMYAVSWDDACMQAGRNADDARKRALFKIKKAWIKAGRDDWQERYQRTKESVLALAGAEMPRSHQPALLLVAAADYEDVAMPDDPEPMLPFLVN